MKNYSMKNTLPLLLVPSLFFSLVSCGDNMDNNSNSAVVPQQQEEQDEGIFRANLETLNPGVGGNATTGTALVEIAGNTISVHMNVSGAPASMVHIQHIHSGSACPTTAADTNSDGFVDVVEGVPAYGPILVNLDADLNSFT